MSLEQLNPGTVIQVEAVSISFGDLMSLELLSINHLGLYSTFVSISFGDLMSLELRFPVSGGAV